MKLLSHRYSSLQTTTALLGLSLSAFSASLIVFLLSRASSQETVVESVEPTPSEAFFRERYQKFRLALANASSPLSFIDLDSPQSQTLQWLVEQDTTIDNNDLSRLEQRYALMLIYFGNSGNTWENLPLSEEYATNECDFSGISCESGRVTAVFWPDLGVAGRIPDEIALLTSLEVLNLSSNKLSGTIPEAIYELTNLERLVLSFNQLSSTISPSIAKLTGLESLVLNANNIFGQVPYEITQLKSLRIINLYGNSRLSGPILDSITQLPNLEFFNVDTTNLTGTFPTNFTSMTNLNTFSAFKTYFEGTFPSSFTSMTNLDSILLETRSLAEMTIPDTIDQLTNLKEFSIEGPNLRGTIPSQLGDLASLEYLQLVGTRLSGTIPSELVRLTSLRVLGINRNNLDGTIPNIFVDMDDLELLDTSQNQLTGVIPQSACSRQRPGLTFIYDCSHDCDLTCCVLTCRD